jgi:hypothetical protein
MSVEVNGNSSGPMTVWLWLVFGSPRCPLQGSCSCRPLCDRNDPDLVAAFGCCDVDKVAR